MLKQLICWLWGCKTVHKAFTGETMPHHDRLLNQVIQAPLFRWERTNFCTRCGKDACQIKIVIPQSSISPRSGK